MEMKIAAYVGSKDEVELIGPAIANLRAIGVSHVLASDAGSRDGTAEVLQGMARAPGLDYLPYDDLNLDPEHEARETAKIIARAETVGADWLLFVDADEIPLPWAGRLQDIAELDDADALVIDRFNVPLLETGPAIGLPMIDARRGDVLLYAPDEARHATQVRVRNDADAPWVAAIPAPKLMMRLNRGFVPKEGQHGVIAPSGSEPRIVVPRDLIIAHVPFSTEARFARKMANVQAIWEETGHHWGPNSAWHWRRWLDNIAERGGVAGEIARNRLTAEELFALRAAGVVKSANEVWRRVRI
jgi:hypothetical protein